MVAFRPIVLAVLLLFNVEILGAQREGIRLKENEKTYKGISQNDSPFTVSLEKSTNKGRWELFAEDGSLVTLSKPTRTSRLDTYTATPTGPGQVILTAKYKKKGSRGWKKSYVKSKEKTITFTISKPRSKRVAELPKVKAWKTEFSLVNSPNNVVTQSNNLKVVNDTYSLTHGVGQAIRLDLPSYYTPWTYQKSPTKMTVDREFTRAKQPGDLVDSVQVTLDAVGAHHLTFLWKHNPDIPGMRPKRGGQLVDMISKRLEIKVVATLDELD